MKKLVLIFILPFVGSLFGQVEDVRITADGTVINTKTVKFATGKLMVNGVAVVGGGVTSVTGTAPIVSSGGATPAISITAATTGAPGSMSAADKTKLDGIAAGAQPGTVTSVSVSGANGIGITGSPITTSGTIALSLGAITPTSVAASGAVSGSNLSGTNTGDQTSIVGITGTTAEFNTALSDANFATGGGTATGTNTGDQDLSALALKATTISTTSPLTGGGDLSTNRTFAINNAAADGTTKGAASFTAADFDAASGNIGIDYTNGQAATTSLKGFLTSTDWNTFNNKGAGTVTNFSAGDLSPLFTTSEATTTTTPTLTFSLSTAAANTFFGNGTGSTAAPTFMSASTAKTALAIAVGDVSGAAPIASPTFTGTVTIPTPFTLGAVSVLPTGTELNFVDGVTSAIQTQLDAKAPLVSPSFTTPNINVASGTSLALGSDPADAGVLRLENAAVIGWEASPASTDVTLTVNTSEQFVFSNSILSPTFVTPALGTPASGVATNLTGTASGLTAGNVTTNANLTGQVTSVGNAATTTNYSARVYNSAAISIPNVTVTALTFDSERWDTDTIHSTSSNTSRLTCKTAGKYQIDSTIEFVANAAGGRTILIRLNGTTLIGYQSFGADPVPGNTIGISCSTIYDLAVNDYVELVAYQSSGGNLNIAAAGNYSPEFMMSRLP